MTNTFANAKENVTDEQLKHVTGGTRVNSRPHAAEDHLIDHGDLHGTAAADGYRLPPPPPACIPVIEKFQFSGPVTVQGLEDDSGHAITGVEQIDVWANGEVSVVEAIPGQPGHYGDLVLGEASRGSLGAFFSQEIVNDAVAQGDQVSITGYPVLQLSLPNKG
ncbi:hypothetical protein [Bradyrhizobium sp.]|uniref:hypothetical protein n=1 Tax=Bradyrhizobium sp. TaxID=376 RepID=UPI003C77A004